MFANEGQIYTHDVVRGTTPRQITFDGVRRPSSRPTGREWCSPLCASGSDLFVRDLNDDAPPRLLITLEGAQFPSQWPSDGLITFANGGPPFDLWTLDLSDPDAPQASSYLTSEADLRPLMVSPDGTLAAYSSNETGSYELYVRSFPDPGERTLISDGQGQDGGVIRVWWAPDGATLYYWVGTQGDRTVVAARLQRQPVPAVLSTDTLFTVPAFGSPYDILHPDGDRFIFAFPQDVAATAEGEDGPPPRLVLVQSFWEELERLAGN